MPAAKAFLTLVRVRVIGPLKTDCGPREFSEAAIQKRKTEA